jgi:methylated-DNA-protein-cysteine methyltransferase-like protein
MVFRQSEMKSKSPPSRTVREKGGAPRFFPSFHSTMNKSQTSSDHGTLILSIERVIRAIPRGKVLTYGGVAKAAGLPGLARMVARVLRRGFGLPWQRVLGAGGEIKLRGDSAAEQRLRLQAEGVRFRGRKVDMKACEWKPTLSKRQKQRPLQRSSRRQK